jgi:hypothetical protein
MTVGREWFEKGDDYTEDKSGIQVAYPTQSSEHTRRHTNIFALTTATHG